MEGIKKTKTRAQSRVKQQVFTMMLNGGKKGISYLVEPNNTANIEEATLMSAIIYKHDMKADEWVGLGSVMGSENLFDAGVYNSTPWKEDPKIDELVEAVIKNRGVSLSSQMKKIGRNEPCYCGSKKKYKKCHGR